MNKYKEKLNKEIENLHNISKNLVLNINIKQYKRAEQEGFLTKIMKGWYFLNQPEGKNNTTIWQKDYYHFLSQYLEKHFGQDYIISADNSLKMHTKDTEVQKQIVVHVKNNSHLRNFKNEYSLLIVHSNKDFNNINKIKNDYGLLVYTLSDALLNITPTFFKNNPFEAELALKMVKSHQDFFVKDNSEFSF
jgi:predicted transcriptional regulator of viral defense system